jgi:hypothetical protein
MLTTVYTEDLENIVNALSAGKINKADALEQIQTINTRLPVDQPVASSKKESYLWLYADGQKYLGEIAQNGTNSEINNYKNGTNSEINNYK